MIPRPVSRDMVIWTASSISGFLVILGSASAVLNLDHLAFFSNTSTLLFYMGVVLLSSVSIWGWYRGGISRRLSLLQISSLFIGLYVVPVLVIGPPNAEHAFDFLTFPIGIIRVGHWVNAYATFLSWPGSWIFYSGFLMITNVKGLRTIIEIFPVLWQAVFSLLIFTTCFKVSGSKNAAAIGVWIFLLADWLDQAYASDQSLGLALFLLGTLMLLREPVSNLRGRTKVLLMVVVAALAISHILSALIMVSSIFILSIFKKQLRFVAVIGVATLAAWNLLAVESSLQSFMRAALSGLTNFAGWFQSGVSSPLSYSNPIHAEATRLELVDVVSLGLIALASLMLQYRASKGPKLSKLWLVVAIEVGIVSVVLATNTAGGNELFQRAFLFSLVPFSILASNSRNVRLFALALVMFSIFAAPMNLVAQYNTFATSEVTPSMYQGMVYLNSYSSGGTVIGALFPGLASGGLFGPLGGQYALSAFSKNPCNMVALDPLYVSFTPSDYATLSYDFGDNLTLPALSVFLSNSASSVLALSANHVLLYATSCA